MKIITDKILNQGEDFKNVHFVRCLNVGANLTHCTWDNGSFIFGTFDDGIWNSGIWINGYWDMFRSNRLSVWKDGIKFDKRIKNENY